MGWCARSAASTIRPACHCNASAAASRRTGCMGAPTASRAATPSCMATAIHSALLARLGALIHDALKPQPEQVALLSAALAILGCADTCYLADIAVAPTPERWDDRLIRDPILIVEILSPSTTAFDRQTKVPDYRRIASVREILLVDSESVFAEIQIGR